MNINDEMLQAMIEKSQFGKSDKPALNDEEHWYSFPNQKVLAYNMAYELVINGEEVDTAIETAKTFVDEFYARAMRAGAWERK